MRHPLSMLTRTLLPLAMLSAGFVAPAVAAPDVDRLERSIVRVVVGGHGTGWVVSPGVIATNWHVAEGTQSFDIIPAGTSDVYSGSVIWIGNSELDLALLSVPGLPLEPLPIHTTDVPRGSPAYTTGFPGLGDDLTGRANLDVSVYGGTIALAVENTSGVRIIQHTNIVNAGNSGGPLLDECGRVLGLTTWGVENEGIQADFIWASMHVAELAAQMDRLGIPYTADNSPCVVAGGANVDISGAVTEAVDQAMGNAVSTASEAASAATQAAQAAQEAARNQEQANEQRFAALMKQLYGWGAGIGVALALVLAVALRRPRERILHAVESVSRVIKRSSASTVAGQQRSAGAGAKQGLVLSGAAANGKLVSFPLEASVLEGQGISLGRDAALVDFSIADDLVSRRHVRFTYADGKVRIEDLNSTNGTFLNGRQVAVFMPVDLHVGDSIRVGGLTLAVSTLNR